MLKSYSTSGTIEYDPLMRLYRNYSTYFIRDGAGAGQLLGEYIRGNIAARYVPGPGVDEPLALVLRTGARSWYHADERGSVIAWSNDGGSNSRIVTYDEYGRSGNGAPGRFGYTGQTHLLSDIYDYKARNYNPRLGRFLQTDPIGYGDGMNLYGYVGGDPVNATDPSGTCAEIVMAHGGDCAGPTARNYVANLVANGSISSASARDLIRDVTAYLRGEMTFEAVKSNYQSSVYWAGVAASVSTFGPSNSLSDRGFSGANSQTPNILLASVNLAEGRIRHAPVDDVFGASPVWWSRLDTAGGGRFSRYLGNYLEAILTGTIPGNRPTLEARSAGLPGGKGAFYQRYDVPGSQAFPDLFSGARVAWQPGSNLIYLGPYHGDPHPLVPQGWIRLRYGPRGR